MAGQEALALQRRVLAVMDEFSRGLYQAFPWPAAQAKALPDAARAMTALFVTRQTSKDYVALVRGWPAPEVRVDHALKPDDAPDDALPQDAVTRFQRLATLQLDVPVWATEQYPQGIGATLPALAERQAGVGHLTAFEQCHCEAIKPF